MEFDFRLKRQIQMCVEAETWEADLSVSGADKRRNAIAVEEMEDDIRFLFWLKHSWTLNNLKKQHAL